MGVTPASFIVGRLALKEPGHKGPEAHKGRARTSKGMARRKTMECDIPVKETRDEEIMCKRPARYGFPYAPFGTRYREREMVHLCTLHYQRYLDGRLNQVFIKTGEVICLPK